MFIWITLGLSLPLHLFIAHRLSRTSPTRGLRRGVQAFLTLLYLLLIVPPITWVAWDYPIPDAWLTRIFWPAYVSMGLYSLIFTLWAAREVLWLLARVAPGAVLPEDPSRRAALAHTLNLSVLGASAGLAGYGAYEARRDPDVRTVEIPIPDLPDALQGFTIAQLSDVHVGPTLHKSFIEPVVDAVNAMKPDMVAITGDLVDGSVRMLAPHVAPLARMTSRHGTFLCTGNHEYYAGVRPWLTHLDTLGIRTLLNESVTLDHDGASVLVGGCTDVQAGRFDRDHVCDVPACMPDEARRHPARILLAHRPESVFEAAKAGFHLQLCGHTHGGQFIPWNWVVKLVHPFSAGLGRYEDTWVYVSRGTGHFGPPVRIAAPSEVTRVRLVRA